MYSLGVKVRRSAGRHAGRLCRAGASRPGARGRVVALRDWGSSIAWDDRQDTLCADGQDWQFLGALIGVSTQLKDPGGDQGQELSPVFFDLLENTTVREFPCFPLDPLTGQEQCDWNKSLICLGFHAGLHTPIGYRTLRNSAWML